MSEDWAIEIVVGERRVLGIRHDGTWEIEPLDAPEAARIFAELVAGNFTMEAERIAGNG